MNNNIPTAEEFFEQGGTYPELAIEFAKLHVQAALEAAANNATTERELANPYDTNSVYLIVDKQSILNSYPLDNIK